MTQTKFELPKGWTLAPLGELLLFQNGFNTDKSSYGRGLPFANVLEVIKHRHLTARSIPGRVSTTAAETNRYLVSRGDILFNRTSETQEEVGLASVYLDDEPVIFGGFVLRGKPISDRLVPEFAGYALRSAFVRQQIFAAGQGGIRANIGQQSLSSVNVQLPDKAEQQAIAAALSDADSVVAGLERVIAKKRLIKQGAMQDLLAARRRLPGFSGDWEVKKLGDALKVRHGRSQKEVEHPTGEYPILATGGQIGTATKFLCEKPSVLIGRKGTIDVPRFMDKPFWSVDTLFYTDVHEGYDAKFLFYVFQMVDWMSYNEASGVPSLNAKTIENIEVQIPKHDEQQAIAAILSDMDVEIQTLEARLAKARAVKEGMMQNLLTGRVRLV